MTVPAPVHLHIERLVVSGTLCAPAQRSRLAQQLQLELQSLLSKQGLPRREYGAHWAWLSLPPMTLAGDRAAPLAQGLAKALYEGLHDA